jgi:hypothetical protein
MTEHDNVHRDLGMLRGEMSGVQENIRRVEKKVDEGFASITEQIQNLRTSQDFARGIGYVLTGLVAALVSALATFFLKWLGK